MDIDEVVQKLKRKCNLDDNKKLNKKSKHMENSEKICSICDNKFNQPPFIQIECGHHFHLYCMLKREIDNYAYLKPFMCTICNKDFPQSNLELKNKIDIIMLVNIYFDIFKTVLTNSKSTGRDFYEYKRNLFYVITKRISHKIGCEIKFLDNYNRKFIIKGNNIWKDDILITKFDYVKFN